MKACAVVRSGTNHDLGGYVSIPPNAIERERTKVYTMCPYQVSKGADTWEIWKYITKIIPFMMVGTETCLTCL